MQTKLEQIPIREALHFLGWRGTPIEPQLLEQIKRITEDVVKTVQPRVIIKRFMIEESGNLASTVFSPKGEDVRAMLCGCDEAVLLAATLGAQSERMLLRCQSLDPSQAVLLDAVLSAAIEAVCDEREAALRSELALEGLYLTDRFSPGYGDMPLGQTREICEVLRADRAIGLAVSSSGIMIPRKSVTAIMGVSKTPVKRRETGCLVCAMRETCALRRRDNQ